MQPHTCSSRCSRVLRVVLWYREAQLNVSFAADDACGQGVSREEARPSSDFPSANYATLLPLLERRTVAVSPRDRHNHSARKSAFACPSVHKLLHLAIRPHVSRVSQELHLNNLYVYSQLAHSVSRRRCCYCRRRRTDRPGRTDSNRAICIVSSKRSSSGQGQRDLLTRTRE